MTGVDIHVRAGEVFTTAQIGTRTVAVLWGKADDGPWFVSDGHGAAMRCASHVAATHELMRIALGASGGVATVTVTQTPERPASQQPTAKDG